MHPSPAAFFRFASEQIELLLDLFNAHRQLTEGELHQFVRRHRNASEPTPEHVVRRLLELGFIEPAADSSARFELTRPIETLLRHLLREQRLSSAAVVQGYINALQLLSQELEQAVQHSSRSMATRVLDEIAGEMEHIRQDSHANRDSITSESVRLRTNAERRTPRERYEIVNRLWEHYLTPLRDLLDVDQAMEHCLDRLRRLLEEGLLTFDADGHLSHQFRDAGARLLRLRRETSDDLTECLREVAPLYRSLQRDARLVQGASEALRIVRAQGMEALGLTQRFPLSSFRREGLLSDGTLNAYLHEVRHYEPPRATAIPEGVAGMPTRLVDQAALRAALSAAPAPDDLLAWLIQHFPDAPPTQILCAYGIFLGGAFGRVESAGEQERKYPVGEVTLDAVPVRVVTT